MPATEKKVLSYERLLRIVEGLPQEEKAYVLAFVLSNERKTIKRLATLEDEIDERVAGVKDELFALREKVKTAQEENSFLRTEVARLKGGEHA